MTRGDEIEMSAGRGAKVLIAEGEREVARDLESRVVALGYDVVGIATSAEEAISMAARAEPRVVLMDVAIGGGVDGFEAAKAIRLREPMPVFYLIAESDEAGLRRVVASGARGYLLKPIAERELRVALALATGAGAPDAASDPFEERFFDLSIDMLCHLGFDGRFARLNPAWERTLGFTRAELMSRPFIEFVHPDDRERTLKQNLEVRSGGRANSFENRYLCKDGSYRWLRWNAAPDAARSSIYSVARDVTEQKRVEAELEQLSTTDELTGLWNRRGFTVLAAQELKRVHRTPARLLLFFVDVDRFKQINDTYGHAEGDRVLVEVGRVLQQSCRGSDIVARHGGDEFVILATDPAGDGERLIPRRIALGVERLNDAHEHPYAIELTLGVVCRLPGEDVELPELLARADAAMYSERRRKSGPA